MVETGKNRVSRRATAVVIALAAAGLMSGCSGGGGNGGEPGVGPELVESSMLDCLAPERPPPPFAYRLEPLIEGLDLDRPTVARPDPVEPGRWWAVEQAGRLVTFTESDPSLRVLLDISDRIAVHRNFEIGALGFAFHPRFPEHPWVYLTFTAYPETPEMVATFYLSAFRVDADLALIAPESEAVLLRVDLPTEFHHAGTLEFDTSGMLLVSLGDGGLRENGQDRTTLLGSLLRIDVDGPPPYGVPSDNPLAAEPGVRPEIYASGFRNPWKFSVDRLAGRIFGGDVGGGMREEVDRIDAGSDYGWPTWEGTLCRRDPCDDGSTPPLAEYDHGVGLAVVGGYVYRGRELPELDGKLLFGDWRSAKVWAIDPDDADSERELLLEAGESMSSFAEDGEGEVYVLTRVGGSNLRRIVANQRRDGDVLPDRLSRTGCVDVDRPTGPADHLFPYEVNLPLWSDGLEKERWLSLPAGGQIRVDYDGDWDLPVGSVLVKSFRSAGRLVETRLFMRHPDGVWAGYTYEWEDDETEAWLRRGSRQIELGDRVWTLPTRADCLECHTRAAGRTLGLETAQLDRTVVDTATGSEISQISLWKQLGLFQDPAAPGLEPGAPLRALDDRSAPTARRARDYLHVNCTGCHRPDGAGLPSMDLRRTTPISDMRLCNQEPQIEVEGFEGMSLLSPGLPQQSILLRRMTRTDPRRMPPLGSGVPDLAAISVVRFWILGMDGCDETT